MVRLLKIFIVCISLLSFINANDLQSKIINLVGESGYNRNKSFINKIFKDEKSFYLNGNLDIYKVITTLKDNGLLKFKFSKPQEFYARFTSKTSPVFLLKAVNQSLSYLGYSYFVTSEASYQDSISVVKILLTTEHIIDPIMLLNELAKSGFVGIDIESVSQNEWNYELSLINSKIPDSVFLSKGNNIKANEISGEYWFELSDSNGIVSFSLINNRSFSPKIVFFDKNLNILEVQTLSRRSSANIGVVKNTKFIQITDCINSSNLKGGVNIKFN